MRRRSGLNPATAGRRHGLKAQGGLHARFVPAGYENSVELAVAELRRVRLERVFARIERSEAKDAVPGGDCVDLGAGGLVAQNNQDAGQRRGVQIGEAARQRSRWRRLDLNGMRRRIGRTQLGESHPASAEAQRRQP